MSITLAPGEGAEIKAQMTAGERLVYSWTATGTGVDVDMHGESADGQGGDRSYQTGEFQTAGHGAFEAPMAGNHGWFWQNLNDDPVTVTVRTAGLLPAAVPALTGISPFLARPEWGPTPLQSVLGYTLTGERRSMRPPAGGRPCPAPLPPWSP